MLTSAHVRTYTFFSQDPTTNLEMQEVETVMSARWRDILPSCNTPNTDLRSGLMYMVGGVELVCLFPL
ncbi:hypothetical protein QIS74_08909 [Colletotrichum tabaci]|uniref:Uncharacterized protein n=1 Tax=Colletotrichum tabaci TaxID=1209068 RepID=A0AAV9T325_9PEZI